MKNIFNWLIPQVQAQLTNPAIDPGLGGTYVSGNTEQAFGDWVQSLTVIVLTLGAILFLFFLIWGAIEWITAGGDSGKIEKARNKILQSVIGMLVLASAYLIFFLVTNFLGLTSFNTGSSSRSGGASGTNRGSKTAPTPSNIPAGGANAPAAPTNQPAATNNPAVNQNTVVNFELMVADLETSNQPAGDVIQDFIDANFNGFDDWVDITINLSGITNETVDINLSGNTTDSNQKIEREIIDRIDELQTAGANVTLSVSEDRLSELSLQELLNLRASVSSNMGGGSLNVSSIDISYRHSGDGTLSTITLD